MAYITRKPAFDEINKIAAFLGKNFPFAAKNKSAAIRWRYSPPGKQAPIVRVTVDEQENICSHYANLPIAVCYKTRVFNSMLCTDMATDPKHRGRGLITVTSEEVYKEVVSCNSDFTIGFSNKMSIKVDKYSMRYGYQVIGKFCTYVGMPILKKKTNYRLKISQHAFADLHIDTPENQFYTIHKSAEYLHWRYTSKPENKYSVFNIYSGTQLSGYVVTLSKGRYVYILDIVLPVMNTQNLFDSVAAIHNYCIERNIRTVIYHVLKNNVWEDLCRTLRYLKKPLFETERYLTIKFHKQPLPGILDSNRWLILNGDVI